MKLYELTNEMNDAAESLEAALAWEPDTNADGKPIDEDGNVIANIEEYRAELLAVSAELLNALSGAFDEKAGNVAVYIKNLKAEAEALHKEERALKFRRQVKERALERMVGYLLDEMQRAGKDKISTPQAAISIRNNALSVKIDDEKSFVEWAQKNDHDELLKFSQPEIRKTEVKNLINSGENVPGASLIRTQSLIVK
ncbi:MAG: siphovirus Gp157 family protein [Oscillospiraceae bacterium]|nr:siphovirus Gp157 family protein [Oscillospiraceae bacterium]